MGLMHLTQAGGWGALKALTFRQRALSPCIMLHTSVHPAVSGEGGQRIMHPRPSPAWPPCTARPSRRQETCAPSHGLLIGNLVKVLPACPRLPIHTCLLAVFVQRLPCLEIHSAPSPPGLASLGHQPATAHCTAVLAARSHAPVAHQCPSPMSR